MFFVYFLKSQANSKIYVGFTSKDVERRLYEHNIGANSWTRKNRPFKLIYYESYLCREDALLREKFYKSGIGKQIKKILTSNFGV